VLTSAISVLSEEGHGAVPTVDPTSAGSLALPLVLVLALPALGAVILLLGGRRTDRFGHLLGTATVLGSFVFSVILFIALLGRADDNRQVGLTLCVDRHRTDLPLALVGDGDFPLPGGARGADDIRLDRERVVVG